VRGGSPSADTARTLILVGLIVDLVLELVLLAVIGLFFLVIPILGAIALAIVLLGFVWIVLIWALSYQRVVRRDFEGARTPTLVFAVLSLLTGAIIPGVMFLIAAFKLDDAVEESRRALPAWGAAPPPVPSAPTAGPVHYCSWCGRAGPPAATFCQGCGSRLG